jgi:hypothetical protein
LACVALCREVTSDAPISHMPRPAAQWIAST